MLCLMSTACSDVCADAVDFKNEKNLYRLNFSFNDSLFFCSFLCL